MVDVHLLVLIHGMWGNPGNLVHAHEMILKTKGKAKASREGGANTETETESEIELAVLVAKTNHDEWTYDGIDWGGERITEEVMEEVRKHQGQGRRVTRFSVTGYSLGGLLARYVIGVLHQRKFFDDVEPINFHTIATPHIGIPRYASSLYAVRSYVGRNLLSRSGEQFFYVDRWSPRGRPLIEVLADPKYVFYQGLLLFRNVVVYANAVHDLTVPYVTAAIELSDPFCDYKRNGIKIEFHESYEYLIKSYSFPDTTTPFASGAFPGRLCSSFPPVPPILRYKFPLNIVAAPLLVVAFLPVLSGLFVHFSVLSYQSRSRVQALAAESGTAGDCLVHIIAKLEQDLECTARDLFTGGDDDDDARSPSSGGTPDAILGSSPEPVTESPPPALAPALTSETALALTPETALASTSEMALALVSAPAPDEEPAKESLLPAPALTTETAPASARWTQSSQPLLTPGQVWCVESLSKIPQLRRERAFFADVLNAHGIIVYRTPARFESHRKGECVLRHWADQFDV